MSRLTTGKAIAEDLGVTPILQAGGPNTKHSGSRPRQEALDAIQAMSEVFVNLDEFLIAAGEKIAHMVGVEAATITSGASGGLVVQAAAALAKDDPEKIARLPDTEGMANELIIQKRHRFVYDHLYLVPGAKFVEVGTADRCSPEEVEAAVTDKTAGIIDLKSPFKSAGAVPLPVLVEIAHRHGLPVLCDAASMLPPRENLTKYYRQGADLVSFSGGKAVRGPQSTGLLLGKKEWVEYARLNNAPNATVARAQKVSKEEVAGLLASLEVFLAEDESRETQRYRRMAQAVLSQVSEVPGTVAKVEHDDDHYIPQCVIYFTPKWRGPKSSEVQRRLMAGSPRVYVSALGTRGELTVDPLNIQDEIELEVVARRVREVLMESMNG
jgi:L-seryl-tRNA(Ser) seleniumtransferase